MTRIFRIEVVALVEVNEEDDADYAQLIAGNLLAGYNYENREEIPLSGPGSWAPTFKAVEQIA